MSGLSSSCSSANSNMKSVVNSMLNTTSDVAIGYPFTRSYQHSYDTYKDGLKNASSVELELLDGTFMLFHAYGSEFEHVCESKRIVCHLTKKFPFFKFESVPYISFDLHGKHYDVNCPLTAFAEIFGIEYVSYAELMLKDSIKHG